MSSLIGTQDPKHSHIPDIASPGLSQEVIDFAAALGRDFDPWQQQVLKTATSHGPNGKWAASEVVVIVPRQNGKNAMLEIRQLAGLFLFREKLQLHSAHEFKTSRNHFMGLKQIVENTDDLRKRVKNIYTAAGNESIETTSGSVLRFIARSRGSGRGFTADTVYLDEAYELNEEALAALVPTMSAVPNPQIWYTSSAPMVSSDVLRDKCRRGRNGEAARQAYFEWCADYGVDPLDEQAWADANPAYGIRLTREFIEGTEYTNLGLEQFLRERLGIWYPDDDNHLFTEAHWESLRDPYFDEFDSLAFGIDINPARTKAAITMAGYRKDQLIGVEVIDYRDGTDWVVPRMIELKRWRPAAVVVDAAGPANSLIGELENEGICRKPNRGQIRLMAIGTREATQACGMFYDAIGNKEIRHFGQPELTGALFGAEQREVSDSWVWKRKGAAEISPLVAATNAYYGLIINRKSKSGILVAVL